MGAGQSTTSQDHPPIRALHVLRVTPLSPASQTNIEPFFDFIVGFEGNSVPSQHQIDATELEKIVESHEEQILNLLVWNSKSKETRVVPITPSRTWSLPHTNIPDPQEPDAEAQPSLLGLSMRMCEPELSLDSVWHVLDVLEGSPAESAGLVPYGDWIIGWSGGVLSAESDFYDLVEAHIDKPLRVYIYSLDFDTIREVVLVPNRQWGGEGLLGCVFGFGLLHRIPPQSSREPGTMPHELLEEEEDYAEQLFVPADVASDHSSDEQHLPAHPHHSDDHDHEHPHSHDHGPGFANSASLRTSSWAAQTPTRNHGPVRNGTVTRDSFYANLESIRTPVPIFAGIRPRLGSQTWGDGGNDSEDEDEDGSVAETETTGAGSEFGSLTSVE